jgi:peptidoglycan/LPS O-acetylase OafA/YrhL
MLIEKAQAKKRLAVIWFTGFAFLLTILLAQTVVGVYEEPSRAWGWFFPSIMPTLSLVAGVLVADARGKTVEVQMVDRFLFRVTSSLSLLYLLVVSLSIFGGPLRASPEELIEMSNLWLGPLQGLIAAVMGIFFVHKGETG